MYTSLIPDELKERNQWVSWRYATKPGKAGRTKVPTNPWSGGNASSTNPDTWSDFHAAVLAVEKYGDDGIGFVFTEEDEYVGIDLDDCVTDKVLREEPEGRWVRQLNSYTEYSPSGKGVKVVFKGKIPEEYERRGFGKGNGIYQSGRFFTLTGDVCLDASSRIRYVYPHELEPVLHEMLPEQQHGNSAWENTGERLTDVEVMRLATRAANSEKFLNLWEGAWANVTYFDAIRNEEVPEYSSQSEADAALIRLLAFYTGPCPEQLDRMFRRSGLFRDKWDESRGGDTYGTRTIDKVLDSLDDVYSVPARSIPAGEAGGGGIDVHEAPTFGNNAFGETVKPMAAPPTRDETRRVWKRMIAGYEPLRDDEKPHYLRLVTEHLRPSGVAFKEDWLDMSAISFLSSLFPRVRFENLPLNVWVLSLAPQSTGKSVVGDELDDIAHGVAHYLGRHVIPFTSGSTAGMIRALANESHSSLLAYFSEWKGFMDNMKQDFGSGLHEALMNLYDGRKVTHVLANERLIVDRPYVTLYGTGTTQGFLETANMADISNGFYSRLMFCMPNTFEGVGFTVRPKVERDRLIEKLGEHIAGLPEFVGVLFDGNVEPECLRNYKRKLGLTRDTVREVDADDILLLSGEENIPAGRLVARVKRIGGVLELLEARPRIRDGVCYVREENVARAIRLVQRGAAYANRAFGLLSRSRDDKEAGLVKHALERFGSLSIYGILRATAMNRMEANRAIELLQDEGLLTSSVEDGKRVYALQEAA